MIWVCSKVQSAEEVKWGNRDTPPAFSSSRLTFLQSFSVFQVGYTSIIFIQCIISPRLTIIVFLTYLRVPQLTSKMVRCLPAPSLLAQAMRTACKFPRQMLTYCSLIHDYIRSRPRPRRSYASSAWAHPGPRMRKLSSVWAPKSALSHISAALRVKPSYIART